MHEGPNDREHPLGVRWERLMLPWARRGCIYSLYTNPAVPAEAAVSLLHDFVCAHCINRAGRLVVSTGEFLYIRCAACGHMTVMRDRRSPWLPGQSQHRRATDSQAGNLW
jgi:DNA-directed RNA polymerase subunit RPC12/RpoP